MALVVAGNVRVGWPGAPGWTTTGVERSACCAQIGSENKAVRAVAVNSPLLGLSLKYKDFIGLNSLAGKFNLSQAGTMVTWGK